MLLKKLPFLGLVLSVTAHGDTACELQNPNSYGMTEEMPASDSALSIEPSGMSGDKVGYFVDGNFAGAGWGRDKMRVRNKVSFVPILGGSSTNVTASSAKKVNQYTVMGSHRMAKKPYVLGVELAYGFNHGKLVKGVNANGIPLSVDTFRRQHALALTVLGGYPFKDRVMPFAKIGPTASLAKVQHSSGGVTKAKSMGLVGIQAGAGAEVALTNRIAVRFEGAYERCIPRTSKSLSPAGTKYTIRPVTNSWAFSGGVQYRVF